jgi:FtsH-binding integral membrane protein
LQKHVILTFVGLVLAIVVVAWIRPNTAGGVTLLGALAMLSTIAVGSLFIRARPKPVAKKGRRGRQDKP